MISDGASEGMFVVLGGGLQYRPEIRRMKWKRDVEELLSWPDLITLILPSFLTRSQLAQSMRVPRSALPPGTGPRTEESEVERSGHTHCADLYLHA
ncbi:hypothetical protein RRG08_028877 [Elysia crispata]|uniref:Uncharacterized protein n=1 Tax=Elysia crispata TaxID=231223 RepID=A0AAE0YZD9_9GAST|nr:hypothetical protein RRG08_028877 [Elysia crispata]